MVSRHRHLGQLVGDGESFGLLCGEDIPESESVVVDTEFYVHAPGTLLQANSQLIVAVHNRIVLSPYRRPGFIERRAVLRP